MVGAPAAAQSYACTFQIENFAYAVTLRPAQGNWEFVMETGTIAHFRPIGTAAEGTLHLFSDDIDPDAGAIALLTLDETGRAFVSTHGHFPNLAARTFPGECTKDAS